MVATSVCTGGSNMPLAYCDEILRISIDIHAKKLIPGWVSAFLVTRWRFELQTHCLKGNCSASWASGSLAGMAGFEPTNARVKVWCLTAWRHPNVARPRRHTPYYSTGFFILQHLFVEYSGNVLIFFRKNTCNFPVFRLYLYIIPTERGNDYGTDFCSWAF